MKYIFTVEVDCSEEEVIGVSGKNEMEAKEE